MSVKLKSIIGNLAMPYVSNVINNFTNGGSAKDAGKVSAQLLKKSPFDIPDSPAQAQVANPLSFSPVQYPLDLGSNELGHYILFESGFVGYKAGSSASMFDTSQRNAQPGPHGGNQTPKITAKTPSHSISTSGIAIYMPPSVKATYNQSYDNDTETGLAGDLAATAEAVAGAGIGVVMV